MVSSAGVLFRGRIRDETKPAFPARDQQKWIPVLRPIARQFVESAHDLFAKPPTLWRIMR